MMMTSIYCIRKLFYEYDNPNDLPSIYFPKVKVKPVKTSIIFFDSFRFIIVINLHCISGMFSAMYTQNEIIFLYFLSNPNSIL